MRSLTRVALMVIMILSISSVALATNGDNLIAIGPIARAMGGVGIASPQDAISAVFANPAAMCFGPYCPSSEVNFAGTLFMPSTQAQVNRAGEVTKADGKNNVYAIPAFGLSVPLTAKPPFWRFGLSAYGVTGLGVDYKGTSIDNATINTPRGNYPLVAGAYTQLQIMKFSPAIAFQPFDRASFGLGLQVDYGILDLREGSAQNYGIGAQVGFIYKFTDNLSLGLTYQSPQSITYNDVADFDGNNNLDQLELQSPNQVGIGLAYTLLDSKLLLGLDLKWLNWSGATGYNDFDWEDQVVVAVGAQYKPIPKLTLRVGYNYGNNPVKSHNNFDGSSMTKVQGKSLPTYYYETFRIIGFPAVVEHHLTAGIGYQLSPRFALELGYMHAFQNSISESGTDFMGVPVNLESKLYENSVDLGLTWRF